MSEAVLRKGLRWWLRWCLVRSCQPGVVVMAVAVVVVVAVAVVMTAVAVLAMAQKKAREFQKKPRSSCWRGGEKGEKESCRLPCQTRSLPRLPPPLPPLLQPPLPLLPLQLARLARVRARATEWCR